MNAAAQNVFSLIWDFLNGAQVLLAGFLFYSLLKQVVYEMYDADRWSVIRCPALQSFHYKIYRLSYLN